MTHLIFITENNRAEGVSAGFGILRLLYKARCNKNVSYKEAICNFVLFTGEVNSTASTPNHSTLAVTDGL